MIREKFELINYGQDSTPSSKPFIVCRVGDGMDWLMFLTVLYMDMYLSLSVFRVFENVSLII